MKIKYEEIMSNYDKLIIDKKEADEKVSGLIDKEKKLKVLINKLKTVNQEKESELEKINKNNQNEQELAASNKSTQQDNMNERIEMLQQVYIHLFIYLLVLLKTI